MPVEKSAGAVVFYKSPEGKIEYLLLEHRAGHWGFPKGLIEKGEKLEETALRECREETGLQDLHLIRDFKETIRYFFKVKYDYQVKERGFKMGENVMKFVTYFLVESKNQKARLSFEHLNFVWLRFDAAMGNLKKHNQSNQEIFKKANEFLNRISKKGV